MIFIQIKSNNIIREAAKFDHDGIRVRIESTPEFEIIELYVDDKLVGSMLIAPAKEDYQSLWYVARVRADKGFGPVLYDIAIERVQQLGAIGLTPDPDMVSDEARAVWLYYASKRNDVTKHPLPRAYVKRIADKRKRMWWADEMFEERPEFLNMVYSKPNPDYLLKLISDGRVEFVRKTA